MTDDLDRAQAIEELHREHALSRHRAQMQTAESTLKCIECNEVIPDSRRQAVKTSYCIDCQTINDKKRKLYVTT